MSISKQKLRQQLRTARNAIPSPQRDVAANNLSNMAQALTYYDSSQNIALYWPHDDEINPLPLLKDSLALHKNCFLPVLLVDPQQKLAFASYTPTTPLVKNRYGILEPELGFAQMIELVALDIIFVPVVAFDTHGRRLGRGGGFYDATFAQLQHSHLETWPKLVGLAYSCQNVATVPADIWDWQLDAIVTESEVFYCK